MPRLEIEFRFSPSRKHELLVQLHKGRVSTSSYQVIERYADVGNNLPDMLKEVGFPLRGLEKDTSLHGYIMRVDRDYEELLRSAYSKMNNVLMLMMTKSNDQVLSIRTRKNMLQVSFGILNTEIYQIDNSITVLCNNKQFTINEDESLSAIEFDAWLDDRWKEQGNLNG
jgi:hypothetical protein